MRMCPCGVVIRYEERSYVPTQYTFPIMRKGGKGLIQTGGQRGRLSGRTGQQ
jgi:hypothetical protein